ncbi:MAG: hypothetical protein HKN47_22200 [Pirellulaceae bacterium]|nr:hypothetical protein [Pirellulaceae bacterium]
MTDAPTSRDSLLLQVSNPENREAWDRYVEIYQPVIYRTATTKGLQDTNANDLTEQV